MTIEIIHVDSFTDQPFSGNPAGVCVLAEPRDEQWMQNVAGEMNLSETAFLVEKERGLFDLRWFTPKAEVDLCGHATLASAHVLWEDDHLSLDEPARFETRSGRLTCEKRGEWIEMDFPAHSLSPFEPSEALLKALGCRAVKAVNAAWMHVIEVESEEILRALTPDFSALLRATESGVIVTARASTQPFDFVSRFFAPYHKINEDPVTGSAHCALGPYWAKQLGRNEFTAFQASARGGVVRVKVSGDRVLLGGQAITVMRGTLLEPAYV